MKSTPILKMEQMTGIPPLINRRKQKTLQQASKYQCTKDHPMRARLEKLSSGRLNRSSFAVEARALQREHQDKLPAVQPITFSLDDPPWEDRTGRVTVRMSVPGITKKNEQSNIVKRTLTAAMIEDQYINTLMRRGSRFTLMAPQQTLPDAEELGLTSGTQVGNSRLSQQQPASTAPTTKLKWKPSSLQQTPSAAEWTTTPRSSF